MQQEPHKAGNLTEASLARKVSSVYVGNGLYLDPTGVILPLSMASLDRFYFEQGYDRSNVRILNLSLNLLRGPEARDHDWSKYLGQLKATPKEHLEHLSGGRKLFDLCLEDVDLARFYKAVDEELLQETNTVETAAAADDSSSEEEFVTPSKKKNNAQASSSFKINELPSDEELFYEKSWALECALEGASPSVEQEDSSSE